MEAVPLGDDGAAVIALGAAPHVFAHERLGLRVDLREARLVEHRVRQQIADPFRFGAAQWLVMS